MGRPKGRPKKSASGIFDHNSQIKTGDGWYEDHLKTCLGEVEVALLRAKKPIMRGISIDVTAAKLAIDRFAFSMAASNQLRMSSSLSCLKIRLRHANTLERAGYETVGALIGASVNDLLKIPQIGDTAIDDIREALAEHSLCLRGDRKGAQKFRTMDPEVLLERERNSQGYAWSFDS